VPDEARRHGKRVREGPQQQVPGIEVRPDHDLIAGQLPSDEPAVIPPVPPTVVLSLPHAGEPAGDPAQFVEIHSAQRIAAKAASAPLRQARSASAKPAVRSKSRSASQCNAVAVSTASKGAAPKPVAQTDSAIRPGDLGRHVTGLDVEVDPRTALAEMLKRELHAVQPAQVGRARTAVLGGRAPYQCDLR
jgi:hypothetical protein